MKILNNVDYQLYKSIIKLDKDDLRKSLKKCLSQKYKKVYLTKDYVYAEGTIPVMLLAHMDTVFKEPPKNIFYDREQNVIWSPEGGCGDDRAGIFAILKILQSGLRPSVLFTMDEEVGGWGAEAFIKDFPEAPTDLSFLIQLDRRGTNDCVFYDCDNDDFVDYIEDFGFIENFGSFTDISVICPKWKIAGVNLSIGYVDEHSVSEVVYVSNLLDTIKKTKKILKEKEIPHFEYIPSPYTFAAWNYGYSMGGYPGYYDEDEYAMITGDYSGTDECNCCGKIESEYNMIPVKTSKNQVHYYCTDCAAEFLEWCPKCGSAYEPIETECPYCHEKNIKYKGY